MVAVIVACAALTTLVGTPPVRLAAWVILIVALAGAVIAFRGAPLERWDSEFRVLRRETITTLGEMLREAYGNSGASGDWDIAAVKAGWPICVPLPENKSLSEWGGEVAGRLTPESDHLFQFAKQVYAKSPAHSIIESRSSGDAWKEFHIARGRLRDFLEDCGNMWDRWFARGWIRKHIAAEKYHPLLIVHAYLEIALAESRPTASSRLLPNTGWVRLGNELFGEPKLLHRMWLWIRWWP